MKMNMSSVSLCSKRLDALINNNKYDTEDINKELVINPNYCGFNSGEINTNLQSEPGIVELEQLYNDKYNYDTGGYNGMSDKMKQQYERDLKLFYEAFSDNIVPFDPKKITKFSVDLSTTFKTNNGLIKHYVTVYKSTQSSTTFETNNALIKHYVTVYKSTQSWLI